MGLDKQASSVGPFIPTCGYRLSAFFAASRSSPVLQCPRQQTRLLVWLGSDRVEEADH